MPLPGTEMAVNMEGKGRPFYSSCHPASVLQDLLAFLAERRGQCGM